MGGLGKTLIAIGFLLFAFVAYQLWGTAIETARAQNSLENEFEELMAGTPPAAAPVDTAPPDSTPREAVPVTESPVPASVASLPPVADGDPIAHLEIPRIGVDKIVVAGVDKDDLKKGPGHYPETPLPGQLGNSAIAGHRTTFGQPFYDIDKLDTGDEIIVTTLAGRFVYRMTGQQIVSPSEYQVIATTDPTTATLTLTSCHPKYTARERIIVTAQLDPSASAGVVTEPTINYGRPLDDAGSADRDPTNTVVEPETTIASAADATILIDDPTLTADASTLDDEQINDGIADAFSEGWFSDPGANGQVLLWGLLLAAIGVVSYLISRKAKRDWVGLLVGIVPFVIVLYFFFQNVNRLLPPNL